MTMHPYHKKLARALDRMGGLYTVQDILTAIAENRMQSFIANDSWVVTQIAVYPRAKVLEVLIALGDLKDSPSLHEQIFRCARENNIGLVITSGRRGWVKELNREGWKVKATSYLYQREL